MFVPSQLRFSSCSRWHKAANSKLVPKNQPRRGRKKQRVCLVKCSSGRCGRQIHKGSRDIHIHRTSSEAQMRLHKIPGVGDPDVITLCTLPKPLTPRLRSWDRKHCICRAHDGAQWQLKSRWRGFDRKSAQERLNNELSYSSLSLSSSDNVTIGRCTRKMRDNLRTPASTRNCEVSKLSLVFDASQLPLNRVSSSTNCYFPTT